MANFKRPTTVDLINNGKYPNAAVGTIIETLGYTTKGDGGGAQWKKTGVTGLAAAQSPADLVDGKLTDANGHEWELNTGRKINIRHVGAVGDGAADDTGPVDAAFGRLDYLQGVDGTAVNGARAILSRASAGVLYAPSGEYKYSGSGYTPVLNKNIVVRGDGPSSSVFQIQSDAWLIEATDASKVMNSIDIEGIKTNGGRGLFFNGKTNLTAVGAGVRFVRNHIVGFTHCGFGSICDSQDKWGFHDNIVEAGNSGNRIGLCLPRQVAAINATGNIFIGCKYSVKMHGGGHSQYYFGPNNSFFSHVANINVKEADFWLVPDDADPNAGYALNIFGNRFSNENKGSEPKILIAEEDTMSSVVIERAHSETLSTKPFRGIKVVGNAIQGTGSPTTTNSGIIKTFTADCGGLKFLDNEITQWYPYIIEFASVVTAIDNGLWGTCVIDASKGSNFTNLYTTPTSNKAVGIVQRKAGQFLGAVGEISSVSNTDPSYVSLSPGQRVDNNIKGGAVTTTQIADAVGGMNAAEVTFGADQIIAMSITNASLLPGTIVWFEFDLKRAATNALDYIQFEIEFGGSIDYSWTLEVTDNWTRCRIPVMFNDDHTTGTFQARWAPRAHLAVGVKDTILIAREAVYHAHNPVNYEPLEIKQHSWDAGRVILGSYNLWVDSLGVLRIKNGVPITDTDGTIVGTQT